LNTLHNVSYTNYVFWTFKFSLTLFNRLVRLVLVPYNLPNLVHDHLRLEYFVQHLHIIIIILYCTDVRWHCVGSAVIITYYTSSIIGQLKVNPFTSVLDERESTYTPADRLHIRRNTIYTTQDGRRRGEVKHFDFGVVLDLGPLQ